MQKRLFAAVLCAIAVISCSQGGGQGKAKTGEVPTLKWVTVGSGMPKNYDEILPYCPPKLQSIIECFDELDLLSRLDAVAYAQTIDRLMGDLQQIVAEHSEPYDANLSVSR